MSRLRMLQTGFPALGLLAVFFIPAGVRAADINEVVFLNRIQVYVTSVDTTLVTSEGKRIRIPRGTRLNVAGFTSEEAFVISRGDRPNGFVWKDTIAPIKGAPPGLPGPIKEETVE